MLKALEREFINVIACYPTENIVESVSQHLQMGGRIVNYVKSGFERLSSQMHLHVGSMTNQSILQLMDTIRMKLTSSRLLRTNMASLSQPSLPRRRTNFNLWTLEFSLLFSEGGLLIVGNVSLKGSKSTDITSFLNT